MNAGYSNTIICLRFKNIDKQGVEIAANHKNDKELPLALSLKCWLEMESSTDAIGWNKAV